MAGYSSWFPGFGGNAEEPVSCTNPRVVQESEEIGSKRSSEAQAEQFGDHDLQRMHAMCKTMIQGHEASSSSRIAELQKTIKSITDDIADLKALVSQSGPKPLSISDSAHVPEATSLAISDGTLSHLKDDVQIVVDAMRLELQKHKFLIAALDDQVQQINSRTDADAQRIWGRQAKVEASTSSWWGAGVGDLKTEAETASSSLSKQYVSVQRFDDAISHIKKDLEEKASGSKSDFGAGGPPEAGRPPERTGGDALVDASGPVSRQDFENFQADISNTFKAVHKNIADVRDLQELTAVKAGFLAVAATECNHDEKNALFTSLKHQEEAYFRKAGLQKKKDAEEGNATRTNGRSAV